MDLVERLEAALAAGQDSSMLRFGLGQAWLERDPARAIEHLRAALELDGSYSAARKLLGRALAANGDTEAARKAFNDGIDIAEERGDVQAAREMRVFLKRLDKAPRQGR